MSQFNPEPPYTAASLCHQSSARESPELTHAEQSVRARRKSRLWQALVTLICSTMSVRAAHAEPDSPWGVSPSAALSYAPATWAAEMAAAGVTWVRGFDGRPGGAGTTTLTNAGLSIVGILQWSPGTSQTFPVDDLQGFKHYVVEQVSRYKGVVHHWEVWNEPPNFSADHSPVSYAKTVATAFDAAKSVDPDVKIGLCAKSTHIRFLAETIDAGARDRFDFISLHPYETASLVPQGWEGPFLGIVPNVRAMLRDKDPDRVAVPVWITEIGLEASESGRPGVTADVQADTLAKLYTMSIAQGVSHMHWFDPKDSEGKTHGLLRQDGTVRPALTALSALTRVLGQTPAFEGFVAPAKDTFGFLFKGATGRVLIAWSRAAGSQKVVFPRPVRIVDLRTGTSRFASNANITGAPIAFATGYDEPAAKVWQHRANGEAPPMWDGIALGKVASLEAGRSPRGIHMIDPPKATLVKNKAELDLSGTTGARFAVDPTFLGYASTHVRVTAVLRGHGQGHPGFNLKYESRRAIASTDEHGMVAARGWTNVDGTSPMTVSWDINDLSFVGKYGANLTIDCDSPQFADFSLLKVTIEK